MVQLAAMSRLHTGHTALAVNHQGSFVASTISFNLAPGASLGEAEAEFRQAMRRLNMPAGIGGSFQGTALAFQASLANQPRLILSALAAAYIVLGLLYESYVHPLTILSTLPSATIGAVLALMAVGSEFSIIALIGVILLIGIVKKNAILMIDVALEAQRRRGMSARDAILAAAELRLRPILMTTLAAICGAIPLALSFGEGGELRRPLGIAIIGGLALSQVLTLYTTPVLYLWLDRLRLWASRPQRAAYGLPRQGRL
jgi:multidrug efflux pump